MSAARKATRGKARTTGRKRSARVTSSRTAKPSPRGATTSKAASTRTAAPKRAVKKKAAQKKAVGKKAAATRGTPRPARAVATRKAVRKVVRKAARKVAGTSARKPSTRPVKSVARTPRATVVPFVPTAFAAQRAGAATRDLMLFELVRARAAVKAALQGIASGRALRPIAPGKWSLLEIVLHLSERDRVRLEEFDRLHAGVAPSWRGMTTDQIAAMNDAHLAPLRGHSWDEALRRMDSTRDELMERLARVPADEHVWRKGHAFADTMGHLSQHDRHHAQQIKQARIGG